MLAVNYFRLVIDVLQGTKCTPAISRPCQSKSMDWFLYDRDFCHEKDSQYFMFLFDVALNWILTNFLIMGEE